MQDASTGVETFHAAPLIACGHSIRPPDISGDAAQGEAVEVTIVNVGHVA